MKFFTKPILRYCYRYIALFVFIGLPLCLSGYTDFSSGEDTWIYTVFCLFIAVFGAVLIHFAFWEKFFAVLTIANNHVYWKCPLRKQRTISISQCMEIGVYIENTSNGISSKQIYFSDHPDPLADIGTNGVMKVNDHLIKFWYSDELCNYILSNVPEEKTNALRIYQQAQKQKF